jgi:hypothetical protein
VYQLIVGANGIVDYRQIILAVCWKSSIFAELLSMKKSVFFDFFIDKSQKCKFRHPLAAQFLQFPRKIRNFAP